MKKPISMLLSLCIMMSMLLTACDENSSKSDFHELPDFESLFGETKAPEVTAPSLESVPLPSEGIEFTEPDLSEPSIITEPTISIDPTSPEVSEPSFPTEAELTEPIATSNPDDIQAYIDGICREYGAVGIQVAVVDDGKIVGTYGSGWATVDASPMTPDHKLRVASISKIIIGIVAMQLQEDNIISLNSDIGPIWGVTARSPSYPDIPITIDCLLTHTSTVTDHGNQCDMDYETVKARLDYSFTGAKPGEITNYYYNNYAFRLLGMTLELAANRTLDQYLQNGLFAEMGIDAAFASGDIADTNMLATLYWEGNGVARSLSYQRDIHGPSFPGGDGYHYSGGLTISAADLAKILTLLVNDGSYNGQQLLSSESVRQMEEYIPYRMYDGTYQGRPMVYAKNLYGREGIYFHTGSGWGVYNCFSYDPITRDGVVVLTNGASSGGTNSNGIYYVCSDINNYIYNLIA